MMKSLTAATLALLLCLTSLTPTRASAEISTEDAIAGIFTLLFLGAAIDHHNDRRDRTGHRPVAQPDHNWRVLPGSCQRGVNLRNGSRLEMLNQRCLRQSYSFMNRLPQACHVQVRAANGENRTGYRIRCLRNQGFRISQH